MRPQPQVRVLALIYRSSHTHSYMWRNAFIYGTWRIAQPLSGQNHGPFPPKPHKQPCVCTFACVYVYVAMWDSAHPLAAPPLTRNHTVIHIGFSLKLSTKEAPELFFDTSTRENMISQERGSVCVCVCQDAALPGVVRQEGPHHVASLPSLACICMTWPHDPFLSATT